MKIKTSLKKLGALFQESAENTNLDDSIRRFAAQLTVLVAHVERIDNKTIELDAHIAELAGLFEVVAQPQQTPVTPTAAPTEPEQGEEEGEEDASQEDTEEMVRRVQRETEAEAAKVALAKPNAAAVTPLRPKAPIAPAAPNGPGTATGDA